MKWYYLKFDNLDPSWWVLAHLIRQSVGRFTRLIRTPRVPAIMSETVRPDRPASGTSLRTLGGLALVVALSVAAWSLYHGDYITAVAVLLYVPVGVLLYQIGGDPGRQ